jgi:hypothetical protein
MCDPVHNNPKENDGQTCGQSLSLEFWFGCSLQNQVAETTRTDKSANDNYSQYKD